MIEAHITRIMKRKKTMQKTDLMRQLTSEMKIYKADIEEINKAIEKLKNKDIVTIEKVRGMMKYVE